MYKLLYRPECIKFLKKIPKKDGFAIIQKLELLSKKPFTRSNLDIKKLAAKQSYRLRYRSIRVIFELDPKSQTIYINEINFRGSIYS